MPLWRRETRPKTVIEINRKLLLLQVQEGKIHDSGTVPIKEIWITGAWEEGKGTGMEYSRRGSSSVCLCAGLGAGGVTNLRHQQVQRP